MLVVEENKIRQDGEVKSELRLNFLFFHILEYLPFFSYILFLSGLVALLAACIFSICGSCIMWSTDAFDNFVANVSNVALL